MDLSYLNDLEAEDFYDSIMELADTTPIERIRTDDNKVHGCQSNVWLVLENDNIVFDSDSIFVKGLITSVVINLNTINEMKNIKVEDFDYLNLQTITYQRLKGISSFIQKLNELASINNSEE